MATIPGGHDLLAVVPGSTVINLDPIFPGAGLIRSNGVAVDPQNLGNFTTGYIRKGDLPDGESGVVPIEWFAEHSVSTTPVALAPFGLGSGNADFHTVINLGGVLPNLPNTDGLVRPSTGILAVRRFPPGGGVFELHLNINFLIVLTKVGGSPARLDGPDVIKTFDGSGLLNPVSSIGGQWSEVPHAKGQVQSAAFSPGGTFWAGFDRHVTEPASMQLTSGGLQAMRACAGATLSGGATP